MLAAAGTVILYVGSLIGKMDIATAVTSSVCVWLASEHAGRARSLGVYAVISLLSLLLVPQKTAALLFAAFFGYYPLLKRISEERLSRGRAYLVKAAVMNAALAVLFAAAHAMVRPAWWVILGTVILANLVLPVYDLAVTRAEDWYRDRMRGKKM